MAKLSDTKSASVVVECRFCGIGSAPSGVPFFNRQLMSAREYFVVPSLGSLVPGWTLIVPRRHMLNLSTAYQESQFVQLRAAVVNHTEQQFSSAVRIFEHGAAKTASQTGCGVDHAHLHVLPYPRSLACHFATPDTWIRAAASDIRRIAGEREYLFYSDSPASDDPEGLLHLVDVPVSQFFRRVVATDLGTPGQFDYRSHGFEANVRLTQSRLGPVLSTDLLQLAV